MQQTIIAERRERFLDLIGGGPELEKLSILPDTSRYCLLISDGVVVESYLPNSDAQDFGRSGVGMGGLWTEATAGRGIRMPPSRPAQVESLPAISTRRLA